MLRRSFLKRMALAAIASSFIDKDIVFPEREVFTATEALDNLKHLHTQYSVGFKVSKELLEDDLYSNVYDAVRYSIKRFNMEM